MSEVLKTPVSNGREFNGKKYWNCDHYTEEEMVLVDDWNSGTEEQQAAFKAKHGESFKPLRGLLTRDRPTGLYSGLPVLNLHVRVRLADVDRTLEWRTVKARSLDEAVKIAEAMPDVEVALAASFTPGGAGIINAREFGT